MRFSASHGNGAYHIGSFDGKEFITEAQGRSAFGALSATQTFNQAPDDGKRRVQMNWFLIMESNRRHLVDKLSMPFLQLLSLPVELTLRTTDEGICMFVNPAREIASIQGERRTYRGKESFGGLYLDSSVRYCGYEGCSC